jgi:hypothetical protein
MKLCECGCGNPVPISTRNRKERGQIKGQPVRYIIGHRARTHGMTYSSEFKSWDSAKQRCTNPNNSQYKHYGERGIKFLFTSFEQFFKELGRRPKGMVLDRKDNDGHYEPGNVRWVTHAVSQWNKRVSKDSKSGAKGVFYSPWGWGVWIRAKGKKKHLGTFTDKNKAIKVRKEAERKYYGTI